MRGAAQGPSPASQAAGVASCGTAKTALRPCRPALPGKCPSRLGIAAATRALTLRTAGPKDVYGCPARSHRGGQSLVSGLSPARSTVVESGGIDLEPMTLGGQRSHSPRSSPRSSIRAARALLSGPETRPEQAGEWASGALGGRTLTRLLITSEGTLAMLRSQRGGSPCTHNAAYTCICTCCGRRAVAAR